MSKILAEIVERKRSELQQEITENIQELRTLPEGKLLIAKDREWEKWYVSINGERRYIPKEERQLAEKLARRRFLEARIEDLKKEVTACKSYLAKQNYHSKTESYLSEENRYHTFIFPDHPGDEIKEWFKSEYVKSERDLEKLLFKSPSGNIVRSKSEMIIDEMLNRYGIPYHYEEILQFPNGKIYFPDFKVYSLKRKKFMYWEHLGLMDKEWYVNRVEDKLKNYMNYGIMPQDNLILTMETGDNPLGYEKAESMIQLYLADKPCYDYM